MTEEPGESAADELASALRTGELREQFIAVLGHDLRNPLASIQAGVTLLAKGDKPERQPVILAQMQRSIDRMGKLIDNVLDFARGRLGGGLTLDRKPAPILPLLRQVVSEQAATHPDRQIVVRCEDEELTARCDAARLGQALSNLLGNAVTYGAAEQPVEVDCLAQDDRLVLSVANAGEEIPEAARADLFKPFARERSSSQAGGLGLGLYITAQIAEAHGGGVSVASSAEETRFTMEIPLD